MADWRVLSIIALLLSNGLLVAFIFFATSNESRSEKTSLTHVEFLTVDASKRSIMVKADSSFCSEPVPDAANTFAREFASKIAASSNNEKAAANLKQVMNTEFTKLFERSQGIQALRDGMYRLCEAFLNKALPSDAYREHIGDLTATLNFIVPLELCAKLNREIVMALAGLSTADDISNGDSGNNSKIGLKLKTNEVIPDERSANSDDSNGSKQKLNWAATVGTSELLTSKFTDKCIQLGATFANNLAVVMQARSIARAPASIQSPFAAQPLHDPLASNVPQAPNIVDPYKF